MCFIELALIADGGKGSTFSDARNDKQGLNMKFENFCPVVVLNIIELLFLFIIHPFLSHSLKKAIGISF